MRILVISQFYPPDITAAAFRIGDMTALLCHGGHDVAVVTARPHKALATSEPSSVSVPTSASDTLPKVVRCPIYPVGPGGPLRYIAHYLSFAIGAISASLLLRLRGFRPDVLWVSSPPLFVGISARVLSALLRRPYVLEVRDIWPESAVAAGQLPASGTGYRIGKWLERFVYAGASQIVCVAQPMRRLLMQRTNKPVSVAYNGVSLGAIQRVPSVVSPTHGRRNRTIVYTGNLGRVQGLDLLIDAFRELLDEGRIDASWKVILVGDGAHRSYLEQKALEAKLTDHVQFLGAVSREDASLAQRDADLLYLSLKSDEVLKTTIPSKLFDYMLAARPIIGGIDGEGAEILASTGANVIFAPGHLPSLRAALEKAAHEHDALETVAAANRDIVISRFTREAATRVLLATFSFSVPSPT